MKGSLPLRGLLASSFVWLASLSGCTVTETGNPKSLMGFVSVPPPEDETPRVMAARLSLTSIALLDCEAEPATVATPSAPIGPIDLEMGEATTEWPGRDQDICRCDVSQNELDVEFLDTEGRSARITLRGAMDLALRTDDAYVLDRDTHSLLGYDLEGWVRTLDLDARLSNEGRLIVDSADDPDSLKRLTRELAPFVALYPDWDQDGVVDADERAAPLAVGEP